MKQICRTCHEALPLNRFYLQSNGRPFRKCKDCMNAAQTTRRRTEKSQVATLYYTGFVPEAQAFYLGKP